MFGNDDNQNQNDQSSGQIIDPTADATLSSDSASTVHDVPQNLPVNDVPASPELLPEHAEPDMQIEETNPVSTMVAVPEPTEDVPADLPSNPSNDLSGNDELIEIKKDALQQLSPLVTHLDQSPEDKFRTLMMMIQASDDQNLIKSAYEAAQNISDSKLKAQALLDVVNEINYFTQQPKN